MHRYALPLLLLASCASCAPGERADAGERLELTRTPFTSVHADLLDFELDGTLIADTNEPGALRTLIEAQLLFTTGQLNGEHSVGQLGRLEVSAIDASLIVVPPVPEPVPEPAPPPAPTYTVTYHAKLPVAWGGANQPASYSFTLPARTSQAAQLAFASKYGATCVAPAGGNVEAGSMFLFYRPHQQGCTLAAEDVVTFAATVTTSGVNTQGKSPEYHRVWADAALEVVAMFSHQLTAPAPDDEGVLAYEDFVWRVHQYLEQLQPNHAKRSEPAGLSPSGAGASAVRLAAELPDGRTVAIHVKLVSHALSDDGASFDAWYDAVTPKADVVLYNGHAGLGANVKTLMSKGSFVSGQYLMWYANGCDTFAYVDRTLADRRALLNPDDPTGTKYMDTVTNVLAGFFGALVPTSFALLRALVDARDASRPPKTYEEIFQNVDPSQIAVVTGEEDNFLQPLPPAPHPEGESLETSHPAGPSQPLATLPTPPPDDPESAVARALENLPGGGTGGGCSVSRPAGTDGRLGLLAALATLALCRRRRPH